jgi:hypothetical protein
LKNLHRPRPRCPGRLAHARLSAPLIFIFPVPLKLSAGFLRPRRHKFPFPPVTGNLSNQSPVPPPSAAPSLVVAYNDGALAITAQDASLREILERVRDSTGAVIDAPSLEQRLSAEIGPQPPASAIAALLEGTHLNYAILGGSSDQDRIQRIIVSPVPAAGLQSAAPPPSPTLEELAANARARAQLHFAEETGGDEGVWDNAAQSSRHSHDPISPSQAALAHQ